MLAPLLVLVVLAWLLGRMLQAYSRMLHGNYPAARRYWEGWTRSWVPTMAPAALYNVGYCLHHEGKLEEALAALRALEARRPRGLIAGISDSLLGATLVLLERDPEEAAARLERGYAVFETRQAWLLRAHAALSRGDGAAAAALARKAEEMAEPARFKLGWTSSWVDRGSTATADDYLRGWYHERLGEVGPAREAYARAAAAPRGSVYVTRARAALERAAVAPATVSEEGPSSLSPLALP